MPWVYFNLYYNETFLDEGYVFCPGRDAFLDQMLKLFREHHSDKDVCFTVEQYLDSCSRSVYLHEGDEFIQGERDGICVDARACDR